MTATSSSEFSNSTVHQIWDGAEKSSGENDEEIKQIARNRLMRGMHASSSLPRPVHSKKWAGPTGRRNCGATL
jgi:hypothetical protein